MARLRELIVRRIEQLEDELSGLREVLSFVDELLKELSFRRLSLPEEGATAPSPAPAGPETPTGPAQPSGAPGETAIPLTTVEGELLANMYVGPGYVRIVPAEDKKFHASSRPFRYFVRQLQGVQDRDASLVAEGRLSPDEVTTFNVITDGDVVKEVVIKNVKPGDVRKLKSVARWAFRTMWQQMTGGS